MLGWAKWYASIGWPVFPCKEGEKVPATRNGVNDATTDIAQIEAWWSVNPNYNIGFACGGCSKIIAVDLDIKSGKNGYDTIKELGGIPETVSQKTPSGGFHAFYKTDMNIGNHVDLFPGVDTRSTGGYVLVAPSVHPNGGVYSWAEGHMPHEFKIAELPEFFSYKKKKDSPCVTPVCPVEISDENLAYRVRGYLESLPVAVQGSNGHAALLYAIGTIMHGFVLSDADTYLAIASVFNPRCDPPWDLSDLNDKRDFDRKIREARKNPIGKSEGYLLNDPQYAPPEKVPKELEESIKRLCESVKSGDEQRIVSISSKKLVVPESKNFYRTRPGPAELDHIVHPAGMMGELCSWINESSRVRQPLLTLGCVLAFLGALFGRKVKTRGGARTNMYCMGLCESSGGKNHAQYCIKQLCRYGGMRSLIGSMDVTSDTAIYKDLRQSLSLVYVWDEIGHLLGCIKKDGKGSTNRIIPTLMRLYSCANMDFDPKSFASSDSDLGSMSEPCCSIYGTSTEEIFNASLTPQELHDGWLSRCLVFRSDAVPEEVDEDNYEEPMPPIEILEWAKAWYDWTPGPPPSEEVGGDIRRFAIARGDDVSGAGPWPVTVPATREAHEILRDLKRLKNGLGIDDYDLAKLWAKAKENAYKIALIKATSINAENPLIDGQIADYASRTMQFILRDFGEATLGKITSTATEDRKNRIESYIGRAGPAGRSDEALRKGTPWLRRSERDEEMAELEASGRIKAMLVGKRKHYWTAKHAPETT